MVGERGLEGLLCTMDISREEGSLKGWSGELRGFGFGFGVWLWG